MFKSFTCIGLVATLAACSNNPSTQSARYSTYEASATRSKPFEIKNATSPASTTQEPIGESALKFAAARPGAVLDSVSTAVVLSSPGFVEMNPVILGVCGTNPIMIGVCGFGVKVVVEKSANKMFANRKDYDPSFARKGTNAVGFLGACNNLAVFGGIVGPPALFVGVMCATAYLGISADKGKKEKAAHSLEGTVFEKQSDSSKSPKV